jgi:hypothetical protein
MPRGYSGSGRAEDMPPPPKVPSGFRAAPARERTLYCGGLRSPGDAHASHGWISDEWGPVLCPGRAFDHPPAGAAARPWDQKDGAIW